MGTELPIGVRVSGGVHPVRTILGSERSRRHTFGGVRNAHLQQNGKGIFKMKGRGRWGRRIEEGALDRFKN